MEMIECIRFDGGRFDIPQRFRRNVALRDGRRRTRRRRQHLQLLAPHLPKNLRRLHGRRPRTGPAQQQESVDIVHVIINHGGGIRGGKAIMKLVGIDCGDCRLPLAPLYRSRNSPAGRRAPGDRVQQGPKSSLHTEPAFNAHGSSADSVPAADPSGRSGTEKIYPSAPYKKHTTAIVSVGHPTSRQKQ